MKRPLTGWTLGVAVLSILTGSSRLAFSQDQRSDETTTRRASEKPRLPSRLQASIRAYFPTYRVPEEKDITAAWAAGKKTGVASFYCVGDFNGDGTEDVAIILIGEQGWRFVIFEQDEQGKYRPTFLGRPKAREELGKYWKNEIIVTPQQMILRTVQKGQTWAPEAGDDPHVGRLKTDAVELTTKPKPNADFASLVVWEKGKYRQVFNEPLVELPASVP